MTTVYFVRHAQADNSVRDGRIRPLTDKGMNDRVLVTEFLRDKSIDAVLSSPFKRAVDTIADFADSAGFEIEIIEDFRERKSDSDWVRGTDFWPLIERQWADFSYSLSDGECLAVVQDRNIVALDEALQKYKNRSIVIGTHGTALSTIINYYDRSYGFQDFMAMVNILPWVVKMEFDENSFVKMEKIDLLQRKILEDVLNQYGVEKVVDIKPTNTRAWVIDDIFVLKSNEKRRDFDKSILLSRLLLSEGVPVIEYLITKNNEPYVFCDNKYWCLMKKIRGVHLDPFEGNAKGNGILLGRAVAVIHKALKGIEGKIEVWDNDFFTELSSWIIPELKKNGASFDSAIMDRIFAFEPVYRALPRQIIHRDMHPGNLLFESSVFTGYLDFDLSQRNARIFDLVYLGCGLLVDNYKDENRLRQWRDIFAGIIQGYSELSPLSADELDSIPVLFLFDEILFTAFFFSISQQEVAKSCIEMTKWVHANISSFLPQGE